MSDFEYSPLQRVSYVGHDQVQVYIYRPPQESWCLHLVNAHGASRVLDKRFDHRSNLANGVSSVSKSET